MDDPTVTAVAIEEHVSALSRFSVELTGKIFRHGLKPTRRIKAMLQHIQSYARDKSIKMYT